MGWCKAPAITELEGLQVKECWTYLRTRSDRRSSSRENGEFF